MTLRFAGKLRALLPLAFALSVSNSALAADGFEILAWDNIDQLGGASDVVSADWVQKGRVPVNDEWAYVYDPDFYFYLTGSTTQHGNRVAEFANKGFVVVAAAGSPGGVYQPQPNWFNFTNFSASYDASTPLLDLAVSYEASFVPTLRGFQSYIVYYNYNQVEPASELVVYDSDRFVWPTSISGLKFGANNYLLTGDGLEANTTFSTHSPDAFAGPTAMEVRVSQDGPGTHWKLMLFANGNAAAYDGINLSGYDRLEFYAKASRNVTLLGAVGTGDDSSHRSLPSMALTTNYQKFEVSLAGLNLSDINTLLWVYLHKSVNPFDLSGVSVFLDNVKFVKSQSFVTKDATYKVGEHVDAQGNAVYTEVRPDEATSYLSTFSSTSWVVDRAQAHTQQGPLRKQSVQLRGLYVQKCATGEWVNVNETVYAIKSEPVQITPNGYYINHYFNKTIANAFLDETYACPRTPASYATVTHEGVSKTVLSAGRVRYAFVIEHR